MNSTSLRYPVSYRTGSISLKSAAYTYRYGVISPEEAVIADTRGSFSPSEAVENKLRYLLRSCPIGLSHLMTPRLAVRRPR